MRLRDFIKSENLTVTEWAKRNGFPQPVISRFLAGKRGLSLKTALRIQEVTRGMVRVDELVSNQ